MYGIVLPCFPYHALHEYQLWLSRDEGRRMSLVLLHEFGLGLSLRKKQLKHLTQRRTYLLKANCFETTAIQTLLKVRHETPTENRILGVRLDTSNTHRSEQIAK